MSRSPLAYPLVRSADTDAGGAADLQTDIMRFMAILALCLMAIFALVQSLPNGVPDAVPEAAATLFKDLLSSPPNATLPPAEILLRRGSDAGQAAPRRDLA